MPYYKYWNGYRRRRPRQRRFWRRRFRRPFQRRFWRRKHRRVRKKLKKIKISEWQPQYIKRLTVKGYYPLFMATSERLSNNLPCYLESIAPEFWPGGGGFSIYNFSLNTLYEENSVLHNWWTTSNDNMPLIRFSGVKIILYRQETVDYLFSYNRNYPMQASMLTYTSTHPQAMLLNKHTIKVTCKQRSRSRKNYKVVRIKPPVQMQSKWYFQKDLAFLPLLQTMTTSCSLDRMFLNSSAVSSTIGFVSLDTEGFRNHNFTKFSTTGYYPIHEEKLFGCPNGEDITKLNIGQLTYLGNPQDNQEGTPIHLIPITATGTQTKTQQQIDRVKGEWGFQGNPFYSHYFHGDMRVLVTTLDWNTIKTTYGTPDNNLPKLKKDHFKLKTQKWVNCRYNPFKDKGKGNKIYLLKTDSTQHPDEWTPPQTEDVVLQDLPLWLGTWGYLDYQRKCGAQQQIDTNSVFVIYSKYIDPPTLKYYVPLDAPFLHGHSPYTEDLYPSDRLNWHPKVRYQVQTVNKFAISGPTVTKLPEQTSCEGHMQYQFYFKVGGQPAPMSTIIDPDKQPKYNIPGNVLQTTSLQSPTAPFEYILYNFDQRRGEITKKAAQRITTDRQTETDLLSITETSLSCPVLSTKAQTTSDSSSEEETKETSIQEQLKLQRREQKLLRRGIQQLLNRLTNIE
nr:MAG: ORF1 [TTV-like mini virus]